MPLHLITQHFLKNKKRIVLSTSDIKLYMSRSHVQQVGQLFYISYNLLTFELIIIMEALFVFSLLIGKETNLSC